MFDDFQVVAFAEISRLDYLMATGRLNLLVDRHYRYMGLHDGGFGMTLMQQSFQ